MGRTLVAILAGFDPAAAALKLREERNRLGLSQAALAEKIGCKRSTYNNLESRCNPGLDLFVRLARAGVDPRAIAPELFTAPTTSTRI